MLPRKTKHSQFIIERTSNYISRALAYVQRCSIAIFIFAGSPARKDIIQNIKPSLFIKHDLKKWVNEYLKK